MMNAREPSAHAWIACSWLMPSAFWTFDEVLGVLERLLRVAVVQVPDERVDAVEDQDRQQLAPPVEAVTVAQGPTAGEPPVQRDDDRRPGWFVGADASSSTTLMMRVWPSPTLAWG